MERRMEVADRRMRGRDRLMLLLVGSLYVALALLAYVAVPEPSPLEDRGLRLFEAAGGGAIGACIPGSVRAGCGTVPARLACSLGAAVAFYALGPWGRIW
jgi:hypothetical protein